MSGTYPGAEQPRRLGGRYELGAVLGRGGMAEVFMARDTRLGRTVAVKTLRADLSRDPTFQARFRREAQSAASLNHPAIVAIYDTGEDFENGVSVPYIVMEYADGSTLRDLLHSGRRLLPERALEITAGVLQALDYSHRNGIIHRDIKPANIMLTRSGTVKVMDFGIARAMADNGMTMTQTAAVIGTAQYLSPEQAKGETVDARSDLYSTGCLMFELLTGRPPFVGDSPVAVAYQHVREEPQPPSSYDPEVSPAIDAVVLKSLAKTADARYQSATEMRADIERVLDGRPTEAQTAVLGAANMPTQRLDPRQVGAAAAVGQTRAMPAVDTPTGYQSPAPRYEEGLDGPGGRPPGPPRRAEPRRAPEPEKSGRTGYIILAIAGIAAVIAAILLAKSLLKSGGNASSKAAPDFGIGVKTFPQAQQMLAQPDYTGFSLTGSGKDCPPGTDVHSGNAGTIIAQSPAAGAYGKPGPITYCLSLGPQNGKVPPKATLNGMNQDQLKAYLGGAHFDLANPLITSQPDPKVLAGNIIDVIDAGNNNAVLDGQQVPDVSKVQIGWIVSAGPSKIPLSTQGYIGQPYNSVVSQIQGLGFTNVKPVVDNPGGNLPAGSVTRISPGDNSYTADTPIVVYYAPQPVAPTTPTSSQSQGCDPNQDPTCQQNPTSTASGPGNGQTSSNPMLCVVDPNAPGCPNAPTTSKKGGGGGGN
ncbi:serine/threonine protein kinase [Catenulispora acidiphila DSM 44928]|uniref:non-specific serine/threonine protein kinase n=1 Tax=Catenulispora acidiphila (strain DSM 44928 / JCM 14897 / NBRC 102108 / NRRL B-24433 / ID139908) TaxID=479433 RepID=C7QFQ4_CATAD|nr:Stk1 family PASTA domain-containing Ser/Thr kinase [Catenulispora acidiphila]ACU68993.1 serine/threonine protein kinase [Catenulispora acidiphila DSM 44928]